MKYIITALIICISFTGMAQSYSIEDVGRYSIRNSGTIVDGNIIKGYYVFYEVEKVDRKNRAFEIVILDADLQEVAKESITEPKTTYLMEASYNGTAVMFKFYDSKSGEVSYRSMSNDGKLSPANSREANKAEIAVYNNSVTQDLENLNLYNFGEDLFVDVVIYKSKSYAYKVQAIDTKGELAWEYEPSNTKGILTGGFLASSEELLVLLEAESKNIMSRDYTFNVKVLNKSGEEEFLIDMASSKYNMLPQNAYIDAGKKEIVLMGEYYDVSDKSMKSESLGVFVRTISFDGDDINESFLSWDKDIYASLPTAQRKEASAHYTYFHSIVKTKDGKIIAVGEQYRKQVSAGGVALKVVAAAAGGTSDASSFELKTGNMVLVELDAQFELSEVGYYEKTPNRIILSQGYGLVNQHLLAKLIDAGGDFDYAFLMNNEDNSIVTVAFYDREKEDGKLLRNVVINFVSYNSSDQTYTSDKFDFESEGTSMAVMAGKPGNIIIIVYDRKEKTLEFRMEPINN